ncbi:MAG: glycosyltransferase family 39 protein [Caldilineales bacterium]|nr:glycosyltransferase family 39 protein [Caldilineales bacterium]
MSDTFQKPAYRLLLLGIILAGFGLRVGSLNASSLWLDELIQVQLASLPLAKLPAAMFAHANMPFDILVTKTLLKFGEQDGWLRLSSAFAGTLSLPLIYLVAHKLNARPVPILALALLTVSPLALEYNREIRPYSSLLVLSLLSVYLFLQALDRPWYWLGFAPSFLATLNTHLFAIALAPVFGLYWLLWYLMPLWRSKRRWPLLIAPITLAIVLALFIISPFSPEYIGRFSAALVRGVSGPSAAQSLSLAQTSYPFPGFLFLLQRLPVDFTGVHPANVQGQILALVGLAFAILGIISLRRHPHALSFLLLWMIIIPSIIIYTLYQRDHWFSPRYIIHGLPPALILIAAGMAQAGEWIARLIRLVPNSPHRKAAFAAALVSLLLLGYLLLAGPAISHAYYTPHENLRDASAYLAQEYTPGTLIVAPLVAPYLYHYLPRNIPVLDMQSGAIIEAEAQKYDRLLILQTPYSRLNYPDAPWINPENAVALFRPGIVIYNGPAGEMARIRLAEREERIGQLDASADVPLADLRQLATDARAMQDWQTAITALNRIVAVTADDAGAWTDLGFAYQMSKAYPDAISAYEKSLSVNPNQAWAQLLLANSYRLNGETEKGLPHAQIATELAPELPNAWSALGYMQLALGDAYSARQSFARGLALRPGDLELRYGDAQAATQANASDAGQVWLDLLALSPPSYMVATACEQLGQEAHPACQNQP